MRAPGYALRAAAVLLLPPLAACSNATAPRREGPPLAPCTFVNPVAPGADPWVVRKDDWYYFIQ